MLFDVQPRLHERRIAYRALLLVVGPADMHHLPLSDEGGVISAVGRSDRLLTYIPTQSSDMAPELVVAQAKTSCKRCHRRKKRCDRGLPQCRNCSGAQVPCSFLDDDRVMASYPVT